MRCSLDSSRAAAIHGLSSSAQHVISGETMAKMGSDRLVDFYFSEHDDAGLQAAFELLIICRYLNA